MYTIPQKKGFFLMKKATASSAGELRVQIGRFNEPTQTLMVEEGSTIQDVIEKAGISLSSSETLWVDGEKAETHFEVEDGDRIQVVGKKEGGLDPEPQVDEEFVDEELDSEDAPTPEEE